MKKLLIIALTFILFIPLNHSRNIVDIPENLPSKEDVVAFINEIGNRMSKEKFFLNGNVILELAILTGKIDYFMNDSIWLEEALMEFYNATGVDYEESKVNEFVLNLPFTTEERCAIALILLSYSSALKADSKEGKIEGIMATIDAVRKASPLLSSINMDYTKEGPYKKIIFGGNGSSVYNSINSFIIDFGGNDIYEAGNSAFILDIDGKDIYRNRDSLEGITMLFDLKGDDKYIDCPISHQSFFLLFDLEGYDEYNGRICSSYENGTAILIDMEGNDIYDGKNYTQSFSSYGISFLIDVKGDDTYSALSYSQCSSLAGLAVLADLYGNDVFIAGDRSQAFASGGGKNGVALLINLEGDDFYEAGNFSQGYGENLGFGFLLDFIGEDSYRAKQFCQASASLLGIAVLMDGEGDNKFSHGFFSQGYKIGGMSFFMNRFEIRGNEEILQILDNLQSYFGKFFS
ncbi:hypothetical protein B6U81_04300 [Thermoplasmatales archaeon ex4484_30]|nr:MAG: hypothetical protein FE041_00600 [Thermoplasmata archaeon]OYT60859.1 MAG: hypothetical protein B6U81_04300 [Thermoplasmatales archaeon ex4484_30]